MFETGSVGLVETQLFILRLSYIFKNTYDCFCLQSYSSFGHTKSLTKELTKVELVAMIY